MTCKIEYSFDAEEHLRVLTARQRSIVLDEVEKKLAHEPTVETRHRKRMRPNVVAPWELRIGDIRVYYDIKSSNRMVVVLAVGIKEGNQVRIGKEIVKL